MAAGRADPPAGARGDARARWPPRASTPTTTATSASGSRAGWRAAGGAARGRGPARAPRAPGARRSRPPTAASASPRHPPNSSGVVALEILNVLERFEPPAGRPLRRPGLVRRRLAPPPARGRQARLRGSRRATSPTRRSATSRWSGCCPRTTRPGWPRGSTPGARTRRRRPPARSSAGRSTSRSWTRTGNAVSLIQSNAAGFGSGVVDPATGVHFQNRGASFSLDPAHPNVLAPGRRTAHTLLPGMLFRDGERRPWIVGGSMGGDIQPQIHVQLVSALVDGGADIATAVAAPRVTVEPDGWLAPPVAVLADGELAAGRRGGAGGAWATALGRVAVRRRPGPRARDRAGGRRAGGGRDAWRRSTDPRSAGLPPSGRRAAGDGARGPASAAPVVSSAGRWQAALTPICRRPRTATRRRR